MSPDTSMEMYTADLAQESINRYKRPQICKSGRKIWLECQQTTAEALNMICNYSGGAMKRNGMHETILMESNWPPP